MFCYVTGANVPDAQCVLRTAGFAEDKCKVVEKGILDNLINFSFIQYLRKQ